VHGSVATAQNQAAFWKYGLLNHALQLAFSHDGDIQIRTEVSKSVETCRSQSRANVLLCRP
jgi:hypothetical protein